MEARIRAAQYKDVVTPLLTQEVRTTLEQKLEKTIYATGVYQKVKRATIPLYGESGKAGYAILMVSFEKEVEVENMLMSKILPYVREIGKG